MMRNCSFRQKKQEHLDGDVLARKEGKSMTSII